jgi:heptosyltransferase-2
LVVQPLPGIGDMIWHLPHLHAIASATPEQCITMLTKPRSQAHRLLSADPAIAGVLWLRRPGEHGGLLGFLRLVALVRRHHFAAAWLLHGSSRYALTLLLAGIPETIGYGRGMQRFLLSHPVMLPGAAVRGHPVALADHLLAQHGLEIKADADHVCISNPARTAVLSRYASHPQPWVALGLGTSEAYKQWGAERYTALARRLLAESPATVFLLGGRNESVLARAIYDACMPGDRVIDATDLELDQTAAVIAACRLYVGNDTGILNLAAALHVPAVGLFGASPPLTHNPHIVAVQAGEAHRGMAGISVEQVWQAASSYLEKVR